MFVSFQLVARISVGSVLAISCVTKIVNFRWFVGAISSYNLLARRINLPAALVVVTSEGAAAAGLLASGAAVFVWIASALFGLFAGVLALKLLRKQYDAKCGCFGPNGTRLSWQMVARNMSLIGLAWISMSRASMWSVQLICFALLILVLVTLVPLKNVQIQQRHAAKEV